MVEGGLVESRAARREGRLEGRIDEAAAALTASIRENTAQAREARIECGRRRAQVERLRVRREGEEGLPVGCMHECELDEGELREDVCRDGA